jgi:2,4-dienoyl-CoA reductase-like NADH-dependent reductase (Old Yellow Enzyme family)
VEAIRAELPDTTPLLVRLSCTDWVDGGLTLNDQVEVARWLKARGVDLVDCSSGGSTPQVPSVGPGYQVPFAEKLRREAGMATMSVGLITTPEMAEEIVGTARDVVAMEGIAAKPYWPLQAARTLGDDFTGPAVPARKADRSPASPAYSLRPARIPAGRRASRLHGAGSGAAPVHETAGDHLGVLTTPWQNVRL